MPTVGFRLFALALAAALAVPAAAQRRAPSPSRMTPAAPFDKFKLSAGPCAAKGYPMTIQVGNFVCANGQTFPLPSGHHLEGKWGVSSRAWAVGDEMQPVPAHLEILYFSYTENQFYEGEFALPTSKIHAWLKAGFWDLDEQQRAVPEAGLPSHRRLDAQAELEPERDDIARHDLRQAQIGAGL